MSEYRVSFFLVNKEEKVSPNGKREVIKSYEYLGNVVVDDSGVDNKYLTLAGKAYRSAPANLLRADRLIIDRI